MSRQLARKRSAVTPFEVVSGVSIAEGREIARSLAAGYADEARLEFARSFGHALVRGWWSHLTAKDRKAAALRPLLKEFELIDLPDATHEVADGLGALLAALDAERAAYEIGRIYTGTLPDEHRSTHGIYYTPPSLTSRLIEQATHAGVNWATCRVLDPACGGGAFLAPVAQKIMDELPDCEPRILIENIAARLRGYELDEFGAWLSQVALDAVVLPITRTTDARLPVIVTVCDTLRQLDNSEEFDLVIGNPPYGRVTLDKKGRERFARSLYGHANLYGLFTDIALRHTKMDGVIAYVTPTSFLAGEYFKNLRNLLGRQGNPVTIDFVSLRKGVFEDVLQETLLATYRHGATQKVVTINEIIPNGGAAVTVSEIGKFGLSQNPSEPWLLPRKPEQAVLVRVLAKMSSRLKDWGYSVSTGPLVWNRHKEQLRDHPGKERYPLIWAEAVTSDGKFIWRADKKNHSLFFEVKDGDEWLITDEPCVLLQRTTAKEQSRRLIATALPRGFLKEHGAVVIENHLNMIRPMNKPEVSSEALAVFINTVAADNAFRCISGSVAVSAYEIESLPLPSVEEMRGLEILIKSKSSKGEMEAYCLKLYQGTS